MSTPIIRPNNSGGSGGPPFVPGCVRYIDGINGADSNTGGPTAPFKTIQAAVNSIGSPATAEAYQSAAESRCMFVIAPGIYTEDVELPTRQIIYIQMNGALIVGNVRQQFNGLLAQGGAILQHKVIIVGSDERSVYTGANIPLVGIQGNLTSLVSEPSGQAMFQLFGCGVTGDILADSTVGSYTLQLTMTKAMCLGDIKTAGSNTITLYATDCDTSTSKNLGGVNGAVTLYALRNVLFSRAVVASGQSGGRWSDVQFADLANDFTGYAGTVQADANSFASFQTNVPTKGTVAFSLVDDATGVAYTPADDADWNDIPATVQEALDELAAGGGGGVTSPLDLNGSANTLTLGGSATGDPCLIETSGSDTSVPIQLLGKGHDGAVVIGPDTNMAAVAAFHGAETPIDVLIQSKESDVYTGITVTSANATNNYYGYTEYLRCRGTLAAPEAVVNGDLLGEMACIGYHAGGYKVFALLDGYVGADGENGGYQMKFMSGGNLPGSANLFFTGVGIGIGTGPGQPLDILQTVNSATLSARAKNAAADGATSWNASNDQNHTHEFGVGGSSRGDGFSDTAFVYTGLTARYCAGAWKFNVGGGISDSETHFYIHTTGAAVNTVSPSASAAFQVDSTTKGFLPPRVTTTQRDAISSPAEGLMVYNSSTHKLNFWNGSAWEAVTSA